jgi:hypothetical protein
LFTLFPESRRHQGFRSYYNRCTPRDFRRIAGECGLSIMEERLYYESAYFTFFVPIHILWRIWVLVFYALTRDQAAETFSMAIRMPEGGTTALAP